MRSRPCQSPSVMSCCPRTRLIADETLSLTRIAESQKNSAVLRMQTWPSREALGVTHRVFRNCLGNETTGTELATSWLQIMAGGSDDQVMEVFEVFGIAGQNRNTLGDRKDQADAESAVALLDAPEADPARRAAAARTILS